MEYVIACILCVIATLLYLIFLKIIIIQDHVKNSIDTYHDNLTKLDNMQTDLINRIEALLKNKRI